MYKRKKVKKERERVRMVFIKLEIVTESNSSILTVYSNAFKHVPQWLVRPSSAHMKKEKKKKTLLSWKKSFF